ncbi:uncharacterized protein KY384_000514 [Bacidia gigantensis]|uniref:uncharacterized protein n=1 Tax=Bacidia gigantensis TaxID=2732470 RepID=UPI001D0391CA|nr:uncharacterized protein KY384_000514 [Bacidia gigantensis]KAG8525754.1 hypothetical protein KY384_000514 [Bacidia gigantensis]
MQSEQDTSKSQRQIYNPPDIHPPVPTYSHIAITPISDTARLITFAGQVGIDPQGNVAPDYASQFELALENLSKCLAFANCKKEEIVHVRLFIVGKPGVKADEEARKSLLGKFWEGMQPPPDTLLYVAALALPELLFEIEATVVGKL